MLTREEKERRSGQRARVIWLYGLSGSGKSTLANALERRLYGKGFYTALLDGDNVRTGLNRNLGFSDEDREENIRRIAEVSRLFLESGLIVINSFITPLRRYRDLARGILGDDLIEVYVRCSFRKCAERDVKGLYVKANAGDLAFFTGKDSGFEEPERPDLMVDTENNKIETSLEDVYRFVLPRLKRSRNGSSGSKSE